MLGPQDDGVYLGHKGRAAGGVGSSILLDAVSPGFVVPPTRPLAFVSSYGRDGGWIQVVNLETGAIVQKETSVEPEGKAVLSPDGSRLFVPLGTRRRVVSFDVAADGMLTRGAAIDVGNRVVSLHVSADGGSPVPGRWRGSRAGSGFLRCAARRPAPAATKFKTFCPPQSLYWQPRRDSGPE